MADDQFAVRNRIGAPVVRTRLAEQALVCQPPRAAKFTMEEWNLSNAQRERQVLSQQELADRVLGECDRVREMTRERAELQKATTERRIEERVGDVQFNANELRVQRKEICDELDGLEVYKMRLQDCLHALQENALNICKKCLMLRDGRVGIDLVVDDVESALQREITVILGAQSLLRRALEQLVEQMRRLRATRYALDRDLEHKAVSIDIDNTSLKLKPSDNCLSVYEGYARLDPANISYEEWNRYSADNIALAAKEVTSARPIRVFIDTLLKQVIEDMWEAYDKCNKAFLQRIYETKSAKAKLEDLHAETVRKIDMMQNNILLLDKALADKESYIGLAHTRMGRRAQRPGAELVLDPASISMYRESELLRHSTEQLQQMMAEATSSLRYLLQTQIQMEEDINVKMNSIKIDEVDCMTLRETMDYHAY